MSQRADQPAPPLRTWRPMAAWTGAIILVLGLVWFVAAVVVPVWQTRGAIAETRRKVLAGMINQKSAYEPCDWRLFLRDTVACLGGEQLGARRLKLYLRLPERIAPDKHFAILALWYAGPDGKAALAGMLRSPETGDRLAAATALGWLGPDASSATSFLEVALNDPEGAVREEAATALERIRVEGSNP